MLGTKCKSKLAQPPVPVLTMAISSPLHFFSVNHHLSLFTSNESFFSIHLLFALLIRPLWSGTTEYSSISAVIHLVVRRFHLLKCVSINLDSSLRCRVFHSLKKRTQRPGPLELSRSTVNASITVPYRRCSSRGKPGREPAPSGARPATKWIGGVKRLGDPNVQGRLLPKYPDGTRPEPGSSSLGFACPVANGCPGY
jgi:hypothetical protein